MKRTVIILTICLSTITSVAIYANNRNKSEQTADYIILRAIEADQLEKMVIEYLNRGYSLAGGVFYETSYHQAVYKK